MIEVELIEGARCVCMCVCIGFWEDEVSSK